MVPLAVNHGVGVENAMSDQVFRTVDELKTALENQVSARFDFLQSCQELIEALYASGKLPGSTEEVLIGSSEMFVAHSAGGKKIQISAQEYDGALRFRTVQGGRPLKGYGVRDLAAVYKDVPEGTAAFVDLGYQPTDGSGSGPQQYVREYQLPQELETTTATIYALMKRMAPTLELASEFPVRSLHAVKLGLLALGLEAESNPKEAEMFWQKCYREIETDKREYDGVKARRLTIKDPTMRRPTNMR